MLLTLNSIKTFKYILFKSGFYFAGGGDFGPHTISS